MLTAVIKRSLPMTRDRDAQRAGDEKRCDNPQRFRVRRRGGNPDDEYRPGQLCNHEIPAGPWPAGACQVGLGACGSINPPTRLASPSSSSEIGSARSERAAASTPPAPTARANQLMASGRPSHLPSPTGAPATTRPPTSVAPPKQIEVKVASSSTSTRGCAQGRLPGHEPGQSLSSGEWQLIALARAFQRSCCSARR